MAEENVQWRITAEGFSRREDARKIAGLIRQATKDNIPIGSSTDDDIRVEVHGYTGPETV